MIFEDSEIYRRTDLKFGFRIFFVPQIKLPSWSLQSRNVQLTKKHYFLEKIALGSFPPGSSYTKKNPEEIQQLEINFWKHFTPRVYPPKTPA